MKIKVVSIGLILENKMQRAVGIHLLRSSGVILYYFHEKKSQNHERCFLAPSSLEVGITFVVCLFPVC